MYTYIDGTLVTRVAYERMIAPKQGERLNLGLNPSGDYSERSTLQVNRAFQGAFHPAHPADRLRPLLCPSAGEKDPALEHPLHCSFVGGAGH